MHGAEGKTHPEEAIGQTLPKGEKGMSWVQLMRQSPLFAENTNDLGLAKSLVAAQPLFL